MVNAYYTCNLVPLELLAQMGYLPRWLGNHVSQPGIAASQDTPTALSIHPLTCPYVTQLAAAAERVLASGSPSSTEDCLIVPGGCDAMRRLGDLLAATYPEQVFVLSMPRSSDKRAAQILASDLQKLQTWLSERLPQASRGSQDTGNSKLQPKPPTMDYPVAPQPGGVFVVAGPLSDNSLLRLLNQLGASVAGLESCTSPERWRPLVALGTETSPSSDGNPWETLAEELLRIGMCPRRSTTDRLTYLARRFEESRPSAVIYARQSFCDPGAYDALMVAELAKERGLPFLELEVSFPFEASGPLRTRIEAFLETQLLDDDLLEDDFLDEDLLDDSVPLKED